MEVHRDRGEEVRKQITLSGKTKKFIARKLGVTRQTLDNWLNNPDLKAEKIERIGEVIYRDLSDIYNNTSHTHEGPPDIYSLKKELADFMKESRDAAKENAILLKRILKLLVEKKK